MVLGEMKILGKLYVITNSTGLTDGSWGQMLGGIFTGNCITVLSAWCAAKRLRLEKDDIVIFNEGVNDCIYRKDKSSQLWALNWMKEQAENMKDGDAVNFLDKKKELCMNKGEEELFQLFTFEEFAELLDKIFTLIRGQGIVLSVIGFPKKSKKIGWASHEIVQTNEILQRKAKEYNLEFLDLWAVGVETYDDVHPTTPGNQLIFKLLTGKIKAYRKEREEEIKNKVILITGGTKGIGKWIAEAFSLQDATLVLNYHSDDTAASLTKAEILHLAKAKVDLAKADITNEEEVMKMIEEVIAKYGKIDILINNAGIFSDAVSWKMPKEIWDSVINTNLTGAFLCTKHVLPYMREASFGRIINITSVVGQTGVFGASNYAASKAGLIGYTKAVAKEVATKNITVNCVSLGYFETGMNLRLSDELRESIKKTIPMQRFGEKAEVTEVVIFLCSVSAGYITGQVINVNGGVYM